MNPLEQDSVSRMVARTRFDNPVILRAGAGTGKTAALVSRVVCWVTGQGWNQFEATQLSEGQIAQRTLSRVVAITFTEAAAAEMADRIAVALHAVGEGSSVVGLPSMELHAKAKRRAQVLLQAIEHIQVRTIHGYCRQLLVAHPLEAGLHPNFEVDASGEKIAQIVRRSVEAGLAERLSDPEERTLLNLFGKGVGPQDVETAISALVARCVPLERLEADAFSRPAVNHYVLAVRDRITETLDALGDSIASLRKGNATKLRDGLSDLRDRLDPDLGLEQAQKLVEELVPVNLRKHLFKAWVKGDAGKAESEALLDCGSGLSRAAARLAPSLDCLVGLDEAGHRLSADVLRPLLRDVYQKMRERGVVGFSDLLARASQLLRNPAIAGSVRRGIDQLLVDEFQDTDHQQCEMIRNLALKGPYSERPGLFLVGDPKQSIYGWRNADLRAYEGFIQEVKDLGGEEHALVLNFRSTEGILDEVDAVMQNLMIEERGVQPPYEQLISARGKGSRGSEVELWVAWNHQDGHPDPNTSAADARKIEAVTLASDLGRLRQSGTDLSDVGILFRSMTELDVYQRALRAAGIPYEVTRDRNYFRRKEIVEAAAMLRAVLDPFDSLALVGFLRSSPVGVPDAALIPLWSNGFPRLWSNFAAPDETVNLMAAISKAAEALQENARLNFEIEPTWPVRLKTMVSRVAQLRASFRSLPFDEWLGQLRSLLLGDVIAACQYQGAYRTANLELFYRNAVQGMEASGGNVGAMLLSLRDAVARQQEAEEARPSGSTGAVKLMTVHKSKGLAFAHTYLMDLHHGLRPATRPSGTFSDPTYGVQLMGFWPPGFCSVWRDILDVERSERVRLLYVAMTRAKDRLVLSGAWPETCRGADRAKVLADLWATRTPPLPNWTAIKLDSPSSMDHGSLKVVFPISSESVEVDGSRGSELEVVRRAPVSQVRRNAASDRMLRPWTMGPSSIEVDRNAQTRHFGKESPLERKEAMCIGTAFHWLFEHAPRDGSVSFDWFVNHVDQSLEMVLGGVSLSQAGRTRVHTLMESLERGALLRWFSQLDVVGMEIPLLMPPLENEGPVGAWVGSIDLIYRHPTTRELVVADFKTSRVGEGSIRAAAEKHVAQGRHYVNAVWQSLSLAAPPAFEVWLLEADARLTVQTH